MPPPSVEMEARAVAGYPQLPFLVVQEGSLCLLDKSCMGPECASALPYVVNVLEDKAGHLIPLNLL